MDYRASVAQWHADGQARRPKPCKLVVSGALGQSAATEQALTGKVINTAGLVTFEASLIGGTADGEVFRIDFDKRPVR